MGKAFGTIQCKNQRANVSLPYRLKEALHRKEELGEMQSSDSAA